MIKTPVQVQTQEIVSDAARTDNVLPTRFIGTLRAGTPSVLNVEKFICSGNGIITNFSNGQEGQQLSIRGNGQLVVANNSNINTNTGANKTLLSTSTYIFTLFNGVWVENHSNGGSGGGGSSSVDLSNYYNKTQSDARYDPIGAAAAITLAGLGGVPITRTINGHPLSSDIVITLSDLPVAPQIIVSTESLILYNGSKYYLQQTIGSDLWWWYYDGAVLSNIARLSSAGNLTISSISAMVAPLIITSSTRFTSNVDITGAPPSSTAFNITSNINSSAIFGAIASYAGSVLASANLVSIYALIFNSSLSANIYTNVNAYGIKINPNFSVGGGSFNLERGIDISPIWTSSASNAGLYISDVINGLSNFAIFTNAGIISFGDTTDASTFNAAAVILAGGLGVAKAIITNSSIKAGTTVVATTGFGCNGKAAQTSYASIVATLTPTLGGYGFVTALEATTYNSRVSAIETALKNNGIMS